MRLGSPSCLGVVVMCLISWPMRLGLSLWANESLRDYPEVAPIYELAPDIRRLVVAGGIFLVFYRVRTDVEVLHIRRAEHAPVTKNDLEQ